MKFNLKSNKFVRQLTKALSKSSPTIAVGVGIGMMAIGAILAAKETPKAEKKIEEKKQELGIEKLGPVETIKTVAPIYAPAAATVICGAVSIACGHKMSLNRTAALASAMTIANEAHDAFVEETKAAVTPEVFEDIKTKASEKIIEKKDIPDDPPYVVNGPGAMWCYEPFTGQYFLSDKVSVREAVTDYNEQLQHEGSACMNDLLYRFGLSECTAGSILGYDFMRGGNIGVTFTSCLKDGSIPALAINYTRSPITADYADLPF